MDQHPAEALADAIIALCDKQRPDPGIVITACAIVQATFIRAAYPHEEALAATIANTALERALDDLRERT